MRRRSPVRVAVALGAIALVALALAVRSDLAPTDPLAELDVEALDTRAARAPSGTGADATTLPTAAELIRLADAKSLDAHVVALGTALEQAEATGASPAERSDLSVLLSIAQRCLGRHELAVRSAERAIELAPESSAAHHARARALAAGLFATGREHGWTGVLGSLGVVGEYRGELAAAIALDPGNLDARDEEIAVALFAPWPIGSKSKARERIDALAALDPLRGALWRAQALAQDDLYEEALATLDAHLATLAPKSPGAPESSGTTGSGAYPGALGDDELARVALLRGQLLQALDRFEDAAAAYEPVLAGPRTVAWYQATYEAAKARQRGGFDLEKAVEMLAAFLAAEPAGEFVPPPSGAWYRQGLCLRDLGRTEAARAALRRALELDPGFERAEKALAELDAAGTAKGR